MAKTQKYGIKYPFTSDNEDGIFLDLNDTELEGVKSKVLHVIFTPKGQKVRDPEFGTNLISYLFSPKDGRSLNEIKSEISTQLMKYVPSIEFKDINVYNEEDEDHGVIVAVEFGVKKGNKTEYTTVAVKL